MQSLEFVDEALSRGSSPSLPLAVPSFPFASSQKIRRLENSVEMNLFELTRALVDMESVTNNEKQVGDFLFTHLSVLASRHEGHIERIPVAPQRDNIFVRWGEPVVTLSTHMDTVPPFFASNEDSEFLWG